MKSPLKPDGQYNEAFPESGRTIAMDDRMDETIKRRRDINWSFPWICPVAHADGHPGSSNVAGCTPSFYLESNTAAFCLGGGGGRLEGRFFFQAVFGVESGQSMSTWTVDSGLSMQVLFRCGGRIYLWEGPKCFASIPFKFGGREGFFFPFSLVSQCVFTMFPLSS
jgi:hypothetical protein